MRTLDVLKGEGFPCEIVELDNRDVRFVADGDINADGSPHAYSPDGMGTDFNENGKDSHGRWVGVLTDRDGRPIVQCSNDPAPGYFISTTRYEWKDEQPVTQRRYVDGENIPHVTVPPVIIQKTAGIVMGSSCTVTNLKNGLTVEAMVADSGPKTKCGEISPLAARLLGLDDSPKHGGTDKPILEYVVHVGRPYVLNGHPVALQRANGEHVVV